MIREIFGVLYGIEIDFFKFETRKSIFDLKIIPIKKSETPLFVTQVNYHYNCIYDT